MAGSYNHVIDSKGNLVDWKFVSSIDNLGDAYEAIEEMYGMIWWLAYRAELESPEELVEHARQNYKVGLKLARQNENKVKHS